MNGSRGACKPCGSSSIDLRSVVAAYRRQFRGEKEGEEFSESRYGRQHFEE